MFNDEDFIIEDEGKLDEKALAQTKNQINYFNFIPKHMRVSVKPFNDLYRTEDHEEVEETEEFEYNVATIIKENISVKNGVMNIPSLVY